MDGHVAVSIDVLRATTAICAAFQAGCHAILPLCTLEGLQDFRQEGYLLAAERNGNKVGDAEYGNSPTEYMRHDLTGVKLAYSTTNGTACILCSSDAVLSLIGCFANITALCNTLKLENKDTVLLCSGWKNDFCLEDTLVAGAIIERMMSLAGATPCGDAAAMALSLWHQAKGAPYVYCRKATHVHRLHFLGADADIEFAFCQDSCPVVPVYRDGIIKLYKP